MLKPDDGRARGAPEGGEGGSESEAVRSPRTDGGVGSRDRRTDGCVFSSEDATRALRSSPRDRPCRVAPCARATPPASIRDACWSSSRRTPRTPSPSPSRPSDARGRVAGASVVRASRSDRDAEEADGHA
eukprot:31225-Pelagococcus_subviridis.AAC.10